MLLNNKLAEEVNHLKSKSDLQVGNCFLFIHHQSYLNHKFLFLWEMLLRNK